MYKCFAAGAASPATEHKGKVSSLIGGAASSAQEADPDIKAINPIELFV